MKKTTGLKGVSTYTTISTRTIHFKITGPGTGQDQERDLWVLINYAEMFTLVKDGDREWNPLFPIVPVPFLVPVPVPCSVNEWYPGGLQSLHIDLSDF